MSLETAKEESSYKCFLVDELSNNNVTTVYQNYYLNDAGSINNEDPIRYLNDSEPSRLSTGTEAPTAQTKNTTGAVGGGGEEDEKEEIEPGQALVAIAADGEGLLNDMYTAAKLFPPTFRDFLSNMPLNRVPHLYCYDQNRVVLHDTYAKGNYTNASYVDGYNMKNVYIFAQAPFSLATETNFWRMVIGERPSLIIVFGQVDEKQQKKEGFEYDLKRDNFLKTFTNEYGGSTYTEAENKIHLTRVFWPSKTAEKQKFAGNAIEVTNVGIYQERHIDIHSLNVVEKDQKPCSTVLIHFKDWVDDDPMPEYLCDMRATVKVHYIRSKKKQTAYTGPILLTCPTGSSKCGVYAVLDIVLTRLAEEHTVGIKETMSAIKMQRYGCFKNIEHYKMVREMIMRFAVSSGVVHDNAIGEKMQSVRKAKKKVAGSKMKKFFNRKKMGK